MIDAMGSPPKPSGQRRRRNATPGFVQIDPSPRTGPIPDWPLEGNAIGAIHEQEQARWEELWRLPQAREWERMQCYRTVALYTRLEVYVALNTYEPKLLTELRQLDMSIGITPKALQGLRWEVPQGDEEEPEQGVARPELHAVEQQQRTYVPATG